MINKTFSNLSGKILIASPYSSMGEMFNKSLIYILSHTKNGSIGLIINHLVNCMPLKSLFKIMNKDYAVVDDFALPIFLGGPTEIERGFFLHSGDYDKNLLFKFDSNLAVSSNGEILKDIAAGDGPKNSLFMIGYTIWEPEQIEYELEHNFWIASDCDLDLLFLEQPEQKWQTALKRIGIENLQFASIPGNC